MEQFPAPLFDLETLLERSQPPSQRPWFWYFVVGLVVLLLLYGLSQIYDSPANIIVNILGALLLGAFLITSAVFSGKIARKAADEHSKLEAISEFITLRRWPESAAALNDLLSASMRSQGSRVQALIFLAGVLARYHRFEEAIHAYDYLLAQFTLDPRTEHALKLGRAMNFLRNDQLFDADRAISDLRRSVRRSGTTVDEEGNQTSGPPLLGESGGLALLEIYRDVKTGHPAEAIDLFEKSVNDIRSQFGHRVADAYALVSRAYDLLNRESEARQAFTDATILAPLQELLRRYPEIQAVAQKFTPAPTPYAGGVPA